MARSSMTLVSLDATVIFYCHIHILAVPGIQCNVVRAIEFEAVASRVLWCPRIIVGSSYRSREAAMISDRAASAGQWRGFDLECLAAFAGHEDFIDLVAAAKGIAHSSPGERLSQRANMSCPRCRYS